MFFDFHRHINISRKMSTANVGMSQIFSQYTVGRDVNLSAALSVGGRLAEGLPVRGVYWKIFLPQRPSVRSAGVCHAQTNGHTYLACTS